MPTTAKSLLGELQRKHQTARARLLEALLEQSPLPYETVTQKLNITASVIRAMQERELIRVETHPQLAQSAGSDEKAGKQW